MRDKFVRLLVRLLSTFALIFVVTLGIHACGDNATSSLLAALVNITPISNVAGIKASVTGKCATKCDGDIADPRSFSYGIAGETFINDTIGIAILPAGTNYNIVTANGLVPDMLAQVAACINNGTGAGGDATCTEAAGSAIATASSTTTLVITAVDPFATTMSTAATNSGFTILTAPTALHTFDLTAFLALWDSLAEPTAQQLVDAAVASMDIDASDNTVRTVRIAGTQTISCDTGQIQLVTTMDIEIDGTEMVVVANDNPSEQLSITDFQNCALNSFDLLEDGTANESIAINGTQSFLTTTVDDGSGTVTQTTTGSGTLSLVTDDGTGASFWKNSVDIDLSFAEVNPPAAFSDHNGGMCFGGTVALDGDNKTDTGDGCSGGTGIFAPMSEIEPRMP